MSVVAHWQDTPAALRNLNAALDTTLAAGLHAPPTMNVADWADTYRKAPASSAIAGPWSTAAVEAGRGPLMAVTEPGVKIITLKTCTQLFKTSTLENIIGYMASLDPSPMLFVSPKDESVAAFSKERLAPMIRSSPVLAELFGEQRGKRSDETLKLKRFPGGILSLGSAGSPQDLAMRSVRIVLLDEIDRYEVSKEGDPILLAEERTATYSTSSLSVRACSPTWVETSRIDRSYLESDQRRPYVACPHCGHENALDFFRNVEWSKDKDGIHQPETAAIHCEKCKAPWTEAERLKLLTSKGTIKWCQTRPFTHCGVKQAPHELRRWRWDESNQVGRAICKKCKKDAVSNRHAGFTASKLFSPFISISDLAAKWILAKDDPESKQTFYNTQLGEAFKVDALKEVAQGSLMSRREKYEAEVPDGVLCLTAGVDVQAGSEGVDGRLEVEVVGWGAGEENWHIAYEVFAGDPAMLRPWEELDTFLQRPFQHANGREIFIRAVCVDSGGHHTQEAYNFARKRTGRNVWAIKGASDRGGQWTPIWPARKDEAKKYRTGYRPVILGVNAAKEAVRQRLLIEDEGPGFSHFPVGVPEARFDQLTAERLVLERHHGSTVRRWTLTKGRANEALDLRVYAYAALQGLYIVRRLDLDKLAALFANMGPVDRSKDRPKGSPPAAGAGSPTEVRVTRKRRSRPSRFME